MAVIILTFLGEMDGDGFFGWGVGTGDGEGLDGEVRWQEFRGIGKDQWLLLDLLMGYYNG